MALQEKGTIVVIFKPDVEPSKIETILVAYTNEKIFPQADVQDSLSYYYLRTVPQNEETKVIEQLTKEYASSIKTAYVPPSRKLI